MTRARLFLVALVATLVLAPSALAASAPSGLHGFLLTADEAQRVAKVFPRTPAFSWNPVPGAENYEFQLSTSKSFAESAVVWEDTKVKGPLTTVPLTLPWMSGAGYSWFARVRAVVEGEEGPWSAPWGFNLRPSGAPRSLSNGTNPNPGMVRWTPVEGATAYEVTFLFDLASGKTKKIKTATTAADLREYYTFHNTFPSSIYWRVRAVREVEGTPQNSLPVVSYGPWSARNRTVEPSLSSDAISLQGSVSRSRTSDVQGTTAYPGPHELVPGYWWTGSRSLAPELLGACSSSVLQLVDASACPLYHVYVYSDADCVNRVHISDLIGSPAYVPRLTGPLDIPDDTTAFIKAANLYLDDSTTEGQIFDAGGEDLLATGLTEEGTAATTTGSTGDAGATSDGSEESAAAPATSTDPPDRKSGLWDTDWPTGRYYWTVVPAVPYVTPDLKVEYHDVGFGEDMCAAGQVMSFGKTSEPVTATASGVPYASGLTAAGRMSAATTSTPSFFGKPVVAWLPAPGAQSYEVQWSKKSYPWRAAGKLKTPATAALLDLPVGTWFYRVRGLDESLPGPTGLTWSDPVAIDIEPRTFEVVAKTTSTQRKRARR